MSYDGQLFFGLLGDYDALADFDDLAGGPRDAIAELAAAAGVPRANGRAPRPGGGPLASLAGRAARRLLVVMIASRRWRRRPAAAVARRAGDGSAARAGERVEDRAAPSRARRPRRATGGDA